MTATEQARHLINTTTITLSPAELCELVRAELEAHTAKHNPPRLLSPDQLAQWLGVERETIHTYVSRDGLPCVRLGPKLLRFELAAVMKWARTRGRNLASFTEQPTSQQVREPRGKRG